MRAFAVFCLNVIFLTSYAQNDSISYFLNTLNNSQLIVRNPHDVGYVMGVKQDASAAKRLISMGSFVVDSLVSRISEADKSIIIHFILTKIYNQTVFCSVSNGYYTCNNLQFRYSEQTGPISTSKEIQRSKQYWQAIAADFKSILRPDITINLMWLDEPTFFEERIGDLTSLVNDASQPYVLLLNKDHSQYCKLIIREGGSRNQFSKVEVGYVSNNHRLRKFKVINDAQFETEHNVRLGVTKDFIIATKGKYYSILGNQISYSVNRTQKNLFLETLNKSFYRADFEFNPKGELIRFSFGFDRPD